MKHYFLLLMLVCPFLSGCPIGGYSYSWWNGTTHTGKVYRAYDRSFNNEDKAKAYKLLSQEQRNLTWINPKICGKKYLMGIAKANQEEKEIKNSLYFQCLEELNTPKYFNSKTGKYERF